MIIVDADACPDIPYIIELAHRYNIAIKLISDITHDINYEYASVVTLSKDNQNVDMYIINNLKSEDILITQDIALAAIALKITNNVINTKGMIYSNDNIDELLFIRHLNQINRFIKKSTKHKKRTKEDTKNLLNSLENIIKKMV